MNESQNYKACPRLKGKYRGWIKNLIGKKFGKLTVVALAPYKIRIRWLCKCDCGEEKTFQDTCLKTVKSCGCSRRFWTRHGMARASGTSPEYKCWCNLIQRCTNPKNSHFCYYGERGITVCERWMSSFKSFFKDMGVRPSKRHMIERKNNNGNYEPSNCIWALAKPQQRNKRNNKLITYKGETICRAILAERFGMNYFTLRGRIRLGWSVKKALETPVKHRPK